MRKLVSSSGSWQAKARGDAPLFLVQKVACAPLFCRVVGGTNVAGDVVPDGRGSADSADLLCHDPGKGQVFV